jgi:hypothetical protein
VNDSTAARRAFRKLRATTPRCRKRKRDGADYPCCGTRDQDGPPFKIDLKPFHMNLQK